MQRAVRFNGKGGVGVISIGELPESHSRPPSRGDVAVNVEASALNRADLLQRRGLYPAPPDCEADVPGLEFSGTIAEVGPTEQRWAIGDRVMGIVGGGGMSTRLVTRANAVMAVPKSLSLAEAAAIPEAFLTAYDALIVNAELSTGETALIHAVASGVGTAAIQVARAAGAKALGTSRSQAKLDGLKSLGLEVPILCTDATFSDSVRAASNGGVNVILDTVGASYFAENLRSMAPLGRMVIIGLVGGAKATASLGLILAKRLRISGSVLRSRSGAEKAALTASFAGDMLQAFDDRTLRPVIDRILPMEAVADAHTLLETNATIGKVVVTWSPSA